MIQSLIDNAWLVPLCPLLGCLAAAVGGRWMKGMSHIPVVVSIATACVLSVLLVAYTGAGESHTVVYPWIVAGDLHVSVEIRVDGLTTMMLAMVTFVSTLVAIFAAGYMGGDPGYPRFFALIGLFVFSMTGLVLSSNYVLTYAFWEGVGTCSYLLIGFWHAKPAAADAAKKAFMVNRLGDFGFALAMFLLWTTVPGHSLSYDDVLSGATIRALGSDTRIWVSLLLLWAATAKSAQIPLYVWLPDAMEGPTPVSALIHAATMVTAGVYLIARSAPLVMSEPVVPLIIAVIGCATALLSAAIALTQTDLKRVLAYSTVSQLGFMFMGLGAGVGGVMRLAVVAAMFHLFTHAFFKALLFLCSGSVMHAMGGVIDMRRFRGLRHRMPITCWTFAIGGLALAGIVPFAGFWSKDEILTALKLASHETGGSGWSGTAYMTIYWLAVLAALMTAFYTGRAFFLTFYGPEKLPSPDDPEAEPEEAHAFAHAAPALPIDTPAPETPQLAEYEARLGLTRPQPLAAHEVDPHRRADHPTPTPGATDEPVPQTGHGHGHDDHFGHESPPIMWVPLVVLAACAVLVGMLYGPLTGWFEQHLERTPGFRLLEKPHGRHGWDWLSIGVGTLVGVAGLVLSALMYARPNPIPARLAQSLRPIYLASRGKFFVDELYEVLVIGPIRVLAMICKFLDIYVVDGLVRLMAWIPRMVGRDVLGPFQNGLVQFYAAVTALGVTFLLLILLFWG